MPYKIEATCPKCEKKAKGISGIETEFGWRIIHGKKIPQAYCRVCRAAKSKKK